jgi:hypothetical protein
LFAVFHSGQVKTISVKAQLQKAGYGVLGLREFGCFYFLNRLSETDFSILLSKSEDWPGKKMASVVQLF